MTSYRNPVLNADWSDPDVIRVGDDFYLTVSTFTKVPGLPILHSRDLVNWTIIGHAVTTGYDDVRPGCGVWAPSLRHHDGRFWIFYGDPDVGICVVSATDPRGPWTSPHVVKPGRGLIDPCPLWDDDGQAYLVHAWAKSRAGVNNRLTLHRMSPDARQVLDDGTLIVDADLLPGYRTLEGPKLYKHDGHYWIFAPAGGVEFGWQSVFRSRSIFGPYEDRIVLEQGGTDVNGPHQGGWVDTPSGEHWFMHFQDRGPYGRVVHLQPMTWEDGWPVMGDRGEPVPGGPVPVPGGAPAAPAASDDFDGPALGPQWSWQARPDPAWWALDGGRLRLACVPGPADLRERPAVLGQRLPGDPCVVTTRVTLHGTGRAGLTVLGHTCADVAVEATPDGPVVVCGDAPPVPVGEGASVTLGARIGAGAVVTFLVDTGDGPREIGEPFQATPGRWVGAVLGVYAAALGDAPAGHADFEFFAVDADQDR
ncbi:glycoside hydrolase family 43 protein [Nonomuraea indica]|uniref:glycoside hydrolase family 43 protein n=1 Tax=Nonomuraea indica TaxID=1581193 RepID=UPI000C7E7F39|nr:glycoside hydrolase 43 family protein [Nonomuraea indica]